MQENRGGEGQSEQGGKGDKPVSLYDLICADEAAGGSGC